MNDQGKPRAVGDGSLATGVVRAASPYTNSKRRSRASHERAHGRGSALLASTSELNFCALDIRESFARLTTAQQLRLYHVTRAACEAQKIAFLQSSAESPLILLLFQELFCSPEEESSPGELILELQKTCFANGLGDAIAKFLEYVVRFPPVGEKIYHFYHLELNSTGCLAQAQFYHNYGNYDPLSGTKIIPEIKSFEFESIVRSSRAFAQRRGLRLTRAMDACLDAIYRPAAAITEAHAAKGSTKEATIVRMDESQSYPFYGKNVSYLDIIRVDRELDKNGILRINTRIQKELDNTTIERATFHVFQASVSAGVAGDSESADAELASDVPIVHRGTIEAEDQVIAMGTQDRIQVHPHDFGYFLANITSHLQKAAQVALGHGDDIAEVDPFQRLVDKTIALWSGPTSATWNDVHQCWRTTRSGGNDIDFLFSYALVPPHRDPTGSRGTLECFVTISNRFYQHLTDRLMECNDRLEKIFLPVLPFYRHMKHVRERLAKLTVACVDLVLSSGCGGIPPVARRCQSEFDDQRDEEKLLFIVNCAEAYWDGHTTAEKRLLLDGFYSSDDARNVQDQWGQSTFLRFILEDVLAPCTTFILREDDDLSTVALLPPELYIDTSDDENAAVVVEEDSDREDYEDSNFPIFEPFERERLWRESSFALHPERTSGCARVATKIPGKEAKALEQCRVMLTGLLLALDDNVRQELFRDGFADDSDVVNQIADMEERAQDEDRRLRKTASAYVLIFLRDALLALPFFSTQQFQWEDDMMLARYMVLQMLLSGKEGSSQDDLDAAVVEVHASVERKYRDMADIALGVDEEQIVALKVAINSAKVQTCNGRVWSWRNRLKIHVRSWLQQIQLIQVTGDLERGQQVYQRFAHVTDESLRHRHFLLSILGDPDVRQREDETSAGGRRRSSVASNVKSFSNGATTTDLRPVLSTLSMDVRRRLLAIQNASCFSRDTCWIPPFVRRADELSLPQDERKRVDNVRRLPDTSSIPAYESDSGHHTLIQEHVGALSSAQSSHHGGRGQIKSKRENAQSQPCGAASVDIRVFPAEMCYAVEAAILSIGVITDEEAVDGFGALKGNRPVGHVR